MLRQQLWRIHRADLLAGAGAAFICVISDAADMTPAAEPVGNGGFTDVAVFRNITFGLQVVPGETSAGINFLPDGEIQGEM